MKVFVTGVGGQLGHDVMNELYKRNYEDIGSDLVETYSGVADGSAVTTAPYVQLDITNSSDVKKTITEINPDVVNDRYLQLCCLDVCGYGRRR